MSGKSQHKTEYGKKTICTDNAGQVCKFTCRHAELQLSVYGVQPQLNGAIAELSWHIVTQLLDKMSKSRNKNSRKERGKEKCHFLQQQ